MSENPLLIPLRMPGETFTLPSGGLLYDNGELDKFTTNGEVHAYPMTAYEEIMMKSPDLLFSGDAGKATIKKCVPSVLQPGLLFAKDVDFLMICIRKVSYGNDIQISLKHTCTDAKSHSYIISVDSIIKKTKRLVPTLISSKFNVDLSNDQKLQVEPLRYDGFIKMSQVTDIIRKEASDPNLIFEKLIDALLTVIVSVDGNNNKEQIREWLTQVPVKHHYEIQKAATDILDWGVDTKTYLKCKDCGEKIEYNPLLNPITFFSMR